jgi:hypothetical protein
MGRGCADPSLTILRRWERRHLARGGGVSLTLQGACFSGCWTLCNPGRVGIWSIRAWIVGPSCRRSATSRATSRAESIGVLPSTPRQQPSTRAGQPTAGQPSTAYSISAFAAPAPHDESPWPVSRGSEPWGKPERASATLVTIRGDSNALWPIRSGDAPASARSLGSFARQLVRRPNERPCVRQLRDWCFD